MKRFIFTVCFLTTIFAIQTVLVCAQDAPVTIQGSLRDGGIPANGVYDIKSTFFLVATGGSIVETQTFPSTQVANGIFTVSITNGSQLFSAPLTALWAEYSVRPGGTSGAYTVLAPRQRVTFAPFAVSSLQLGGVNASQFVQTNDPRLTDARPPTAGSNSYIRNLADPNSGGQTGNFAVSGTGRVSILEAYEFRLPFSGTFLSGTTNGSNNLQLGVFTGSVEASAFDNSFIGWSAGRNITTGSGNTFTGSRAGFSDTVGSNNSFFGSGAGRFAVSGNFNSFLGHRSGEATVTGSLNTFVGTGAGLANGSGSSNVFIGHDSGSTNSNGVFNSTFGENADVASLSLTNATAIGSKALVSQSNSLVLGSINGVNDATADTNVGIGTSAPANKLHVNGTVRVTNGAIYIANPNTVIITSPNGACWGITVNNSGALATFPVAPCP